MLKTTVKANSVSNLTDARYFAAWHVEWLGFDLTYEGLKTLPLAEVKEIKDWIEGPKIVGELDILDVSESQQIIDFLTLEYIQVGMFTPVEHLNSLNVSSIIKEVIIEPTTTATELNAHLNTYFDYVDYFLINFDKNNIDWRSLQTNDRLNVIQLKQICEQYEVFISIDFNATNTTELLNMLNPIGISVKGGIEEKVGFKSFDELDEVFELLEEE